MKNIARNPIIPHTRNLVIAVHGTRPFGPFRTVEPSQVDDETWFAKNSWFNRNFLGALSESGEYAFKSFWWSGKNLLQDRISAAEELRECIESNLTSYHKIILIGHSHGGNVIAYALSMLDLKRNNICCVFMSVPFIEPYFNKNEKIDSFPFLWSSTTLLKWTSAFGLFALMMYLLRSIGLLESLNQNISSILRMYISGSIFPFLKYTAPMLLMLISIAVVFSSFHILNFKDQTIQLHSSLEKIALPKQSHIAIDTLCVRMRNDEAEFILASASLAQSIAYFFSIGARKLVKLFFLAALIILSIDYLFPSFNLRANATPDLAQTHSFIRYIAYSGLAVSFFWALGRYAIGFDTLFASSQWQFFASPTPNFHCNLKILELDVERKRKPSNLAHSSHAHKRAPDKIAAWVKVVVKPKAI